MDTSVIPSKDGNKAFIHQFFQQIFPKHLLSVLHTLAMGERNKARSQLLMKNI